MAKGNQTNHPNKKYAQVEDLNRLEQKIDKLLTNEWPHLIKKLDRMSIRLWIIVGTVGILIPLVISIIEHLLKQ